MYAVWVPALPTDSRSEWSRVLLDDPRVRSFWDEEHVVAKALGREIGNNSPLVYDVFAVYAAGERWAHPRVWGWPVIAESERLEDALVPLLSRGA